MAAIGLRGCNRFYTGIRTLTKSSFSEQLFFVHHLRKYFYFLCALERIKLLRGENSLKLKNGKVFTEALLDSKPGPRGPIIE